MKLPEDGILLRIFIGEPDRYKWKPLYEAIVKKAKELDLAGATVVRGIMGFGANSRMHTSKLLRLSDDMPLIIEIVDSEEYINRLLPFLDEVIVEGLVTMEKVRILRYQGRRDKE
jgi:PII-like signaling protein